MFSLILDFSSLLVSIPLSHQIICVNYKTTCIQPCVTYLSIISPSNYLHFIYHLSKCLILLERAYVKKGNVPQSHVYYAAVTYGQTPKLAEFNTGWLMLTTACKVRNTTINIRF